MSERRIYLNPHETIEQARARQRLKEDAGNVHEVIRRRPGISGKRTIAQYTGLSEERVAEVIRRINTGETGHVRVEYGRHKARSGPCAGQIVSGWFEVSLPYISLIEQADEHSAHVEAGVRRERLMRIAQAYGMPGAVEHVERMLELLNITDELLSQHDLDTFMKLVSEQIEEEEEQK